MKPERHLTFASNTTEAYLEQCLNCIAEGKRQFLFRPFNKHAHELYQALKTTLDAERFSSLDFFVDTETAMRPLPSGVNTVAGDYDVIVLFTDPVLRVSSLLMDYLDLKTGWIVAPIISIHSSFRSLFLISIPKAGTHLLYELAKTLGFNAGVCCPEQPEPQNWYCLTGTNSHTEAKDFLITAAKNHYFALRNHPFKQSPVLLIYRNPLDILVSEANYYHKPENTVFSGYLNHLNFEQRLEKLVNDPLLLGSIRDRVNAYAAWLDFANVIPVSFEELIGLQGGGDHGKQIDLLWSLQLKLHVSGDPEVLAGKVFNTQSATFHHGHLGAHLNKFTDSALSAFNALPQDFMETFGYQTPVSLKQPNQAHNRFSSRIDSFRKRHLITEPAHFDQLPLCAEYRYREHNIIKFQNKFYAVPLCAGELDLRAMSDSELKQFKHHPDLGTVKALLEA
jgi:hypothetical protein